MSDQPENLIPELLRGLRTTPDQHTATLARIERRISTMDGDVARLHGPVPVPSRPLPS